MRSHSVVQNIHPMQTSSADAANKQSKGLLEDNSEHGQQQRAKTDWSYIRYNCTPPYMYKQCSTVIVVIHLLQVKYT